MLPGDTEMWVRHRDIAAKSHNHESRLEVVDDGGKDPEPDKDLVAAVVKQALFDLEDRSNTSIMDQKEAFWWLFLDPRNEVMSLAWCCDVLDIPPRAIRQQAIDQYPRKCMLLAEGFAKQLKVLLEKLYTCKTHGVV